MARTATPPRTTAGGREAAFDAWFSKHVDELRAYCTRQTGDASVAEEVVQEAFARAWTHVDTLREREEVGPWLYRVARNLCVDSHRARRRLVSAEVLPERSSEEFADRLEAVDPVRHVMLQEERELVREALATLNPRHQDVLYLRDVEGLAYEELGRRHGLSDASARAVLARARRRLRDELKTMGQGVFGGVVVLRGRLDDLLRKVGGDRTALEPLTAAAAHYMVVAAAVIGLAAAPGGASTNVDRVSGRSTVPDGGRPTTLLDALYASVSPPGLEARAGGHPSTPTPTRRDPSLDVDAHPTQGLVATPANPDSDGPGVQGTVVSVHPEHFPAGTEPVARSIVDPLCGSHAEVCTQGEG